jgi:hypothetical protein
VPPNVPRLLWQLGDRGSRTEISTWEYLCSVAVAATLHRVPSLTLPHHWRSQVALQVGEHFTPVELSSGTAEVAGHGTTNSRDLDSAAVLERCPQVDARCYGPALGMATFTPLQGHHQSAAHVALARMNARHQSRLDLKSFLRHVRQFALPIVFPRGGCEAASGAL